MSEDGSLSSSFSIRLATKPLSPVVATFSSLHGGIACDPPSVSFTFLNFDVAVVVAVVGVDDDVDEGDAHDDAVVTTITSADSWYICDDNLRFDCGQAVGYSGFGVAAMIATVMDDDTAGVVVNVTEGAATYDNFGDALRPAVYSLALSSEPTADVTVSIGGLGPFSTPSLVSVTFTPANWFAPVAVTVASSAPTSDRPACRSGNRFCAELVGRSESVSHAATSADGRYGGIPVGAVAVAVRVEHDTADPPSVVDGRFGDVLATVSVAFSAPTDRAGLAGSFPCHTVLDLTAEQAAALFGAGAACAFTSDAVLKITFGPRATVVPGSWVGIRDLVLQASDPSASLFTVNQSFVVAPPRLPTVPVVALAASSTSVGRCDGLALDGAGSSGSGGRDLAFRFNATSLSGHDIRNLTKALDAVNAENGGKGRHKVDLASWQMVPNSRFAVTLTATNFLTEEGSDTVIIEKLGVPAPIISVQGANPKSATHSAPLTLVASAALPKMGCVSGDLANADMSFVWTELSGLYAGAVSGTSRNPRALVVAAKALAATKTYTFQVMGFMTDTPSLNNSATVTVVVGQQQLVPVVAGGSFQQVGRNEEFTLDGSGSYDPDESAGAMAYAWSCAATGDTASCAGLVLGTGVTATVAAGALPMGTYAFTLLVSKGGRSAASGASVVEVVAGSPPRISITAVGGRAKRNTQEVYLNLSASVEVAPPLTVETTWDAVGSDVALVFRGPLGVPRATVTGAAAGGATLVVLRVGALTPGNTYTLRLTATDSDGATAFGLVDVVMNEAPSSGSLAVEPKSGYALFTEFRLTSLNWVDEDTHDAATGEDFPLEYIFGNVAVDRFSGALDTGSVYPFGKVETSVYDGVTLSSGSNYTNYTVACFVKAVDRFGAESLPATDIARVRAKPLTIQQLFNISEAKTAQALAMGNAGSSLMVLGATTTGMKTTTDGEDGDDGAWRRRRRLLGSSSPEDLRAAVVANLWLTYAITPVTASDVESLLNILVGAVDTPAEVDDATAASALRFVQTVFLASHAAGVGLSARAAESVGGALTALAQTGLFLPPAVAGAASYDHAADVFGVLDSAATLLLHGAFGGVGYGFAAGAVDLYCARFDLGGVASGESPAAVSLAMRGGALVDAATSLEVGAVAGAELAAIAAAAGGGGEGALVDVAVATLATNVYGFALEGSSGSDAAVASRLDQTGTDASGDLLLRSKLTVATVALQDSLAALTVTGLANPLALTLAATVPFNTTFQDYARTVACTMDGAVVSIGCPLTPDSHTCDFSSNGGAKYFLDYHCPMVVPTCLWWDNTTASFSSVGCSVRDGYSPSSVTCECEHLAGAFVLGATVTAASSVARTTPGPSAAPTLAPSPNPTRGPTPGPTPTPQPSVRPSALPTPQPSEVPTALPSPLPTAPSPLPSGAPSSAPSTGPTTLTTATVAVGFSAVSNALPTASSVTALKADTAAALGVSQAKLRGFVVTPRQIFRRRLEEQAQEEKEEEEKGEEEGEEEEEVEEEEEGEEEEEEDQQQDEEEEQEGEQELESTELVAAAEEDEQAAASGRSATVRRLAVYSWDVAFSYTVDVATDPSGSSSALAASFAALLSAPSFEAAVMASIPNVFSLGAPVVAPVARTPRPTAEPSFSPGPTAPPPTAPRDRTKAFSGADLAVLLTMLAVALAVVGTTAAACLVYKDRRLAQGVCTQAKADALAVIIPAVAAGVFVVAAACVYATWGTPSTPAWVIALAAAGLVWGVGLAATCILKHQTLNPPKPRQRPEDRRLVREFAAAARAEAATKAARAAALDREATQAEAAAFRAAPELKRHLSLRAVDARDAASQAAEEHKEAMAAAEARLRRVTEDHADMAKMRAARAAAKAAKLDAEATAVEAAAFRAAGVHRRALSFRAEVRSRP